MNKRIYGNIIYFDENNILKIIDNYNIYTFINPYNNRLLDKNILALLESEKLQNDKDIKDIYMNGVLKIGNIIEIVYILHDGLTKLIFNKRLINIEKSK